MKAMMLTKHKLGDLLEVTRGASLSGEYFATQGDYMRLTCGNFDYQINCFKSNTSKDNLYYIGNFNQEYLMEKDDIITPLTEQAVGLLGSTAWVPESGKYIQSQDVAKITPNEKLLDKKFCYYLISSKVVKQQLSAAAQQTKIRHTSPDKIKDCTVWIPSLEEQAQIGQFLYDIDSKIALNRQINDNLEAMAKQLYDYWFVQFDFPNEEGKPYKSSGGKMIWKEKLKREIPESWEVDALNKWLEIKSGFPFKSETYLTSGHYKVITIKNVQDGELVTSGCDFVDEIPSRAKDYISLQIGDRLISLTGNCGRLCVVCENNLLLNQRVGLLFCDKLCLEYLYNYLNSRPMRIVVDNLANGAAQANLSPIELCNTMCAMPQESTLREYNRKANVIRLAMIQNNQEIATLTKQRDELLPLLMNGQAKVNYHLSDD